MARNRRNPPQYICVDGRMLKVSIGQFYHKNDYEKLLARYKKLIKLARIKGIIDSPSVDKQPRIELDDEYALAV